MLVTAVKQRTGGISCTTTWISSSRRTRLPALITMSCRWFIFAADSTSVHVDALLTDVALIAH